MSNDNTLWLLALGPAGATALYWMIYWHYRNTDKSHSFERETDVVVKPVTRSDRKIDEVKGTQRTRIQGENVSTYRQHVQRLHGSDG